ncbi:hypothetical protein ACTXJY_10580 [Corynebacterium casei]|jgi:hypothetical protein|uniref:hypothetical protein n=1 Tax=Corynebacterium casei TaxID=160386 RepID=UPI003FD6248A
MFEFRVYEPAKDENFYCGRTLTREQAWEKASFFILNDPRWSNHEGTIANVVDAHEESLPLRCSTICFSSGAAYDTPAVAVDIVEL